MKDISISIVEADYKGTKTGGRYGYKDKYTVCVCPKCNMVFDDAHDVINYYLTGFPRYGAEKKLCARCKR